MITPQCKYNTKYSKRRSQERNEFDERNVGKNMGKNFIFYTFLTRKRRNSLQHYYEWDSSTGVFQWIFQNF